MLMLLLVLLLCCIKSKCSCCSFFWRIYWCRSSYKIFFFLRPYILMPNNIMWVCVVFFSFGSVVFLVLVVVELMIFIFVWNISICNMHASPFSPCKCYFILISLFHKLISEQAKMCVILVCSWYMCSRKSVCVCVTFFPCSGHILVYFIIFIINRKLSFFCLFCVSLVCYCFFLPRLSLSLSLAPFLFEHTSFHFGVSLYLVNW